MRRVLELCAVDAVAPMDRELDASLRALAESPDLSRRRPGALRRPAGAADQEARKRSIARVEPALDVAAAEQDLADAVRERLQQQQLAAADRPADPGARARSRRAAGRRRSSAPRSAPRARSRRAGVAEAAGRGARAPRGRARPRRARRRSGSSRPSALGVASRRRGAARARPRRRGRRRRRRRRRARRARRASRQRRDLVGAGLAARRRGRGSPRRLGDRRLISSLLQRQRDRLRAGRGAELGHRVAHVRAHGLGGEHELLGDLGAAHALGEQRRGSRARAGSAGRADPAVEPSSLYRFAVWRLPKPSPMPVLDANLPLPALR